MFLNLDLDGLLNRTRLLFDNSKTLHPEKGKIPTLTNLALSVLSKDDSSISSLSNQPHSLIEETLPNGFKISIQECVSQENHVPVASIYLVVNAGNIHERKHQRGIAHLTEHAVHLQTKNFSKEDIQTKILNFNGQPGADANAVTSHNKTVFRFDNIETKGLKNIRDCLHLLFELVTAATFPIADLVKERSIVEDELLKDEGAKKEFYLHTLSILYPQSRYVTHSYNILSEDIRRANPETLQKMVKEFYEKWYCMKNMRIYVVGDFNDGFFKVGNRNAVLNDIKSLFNQIPPSLNPKPSIDTDSSLDKNLKVVCPWHTKLPSSTFSHSDLVHDKVVFFKRIKKGSNEIHGFHLKDIAEDLFQYLFNSDLKELKKRHPHLVKIDISKEEIRYSDSSLYTFTVVAVDGKVPEALVSVLKVIKGLELFSPSSDVVRQFLLEKKQDYMSCFRGWFTPSNFRSRTYRFIDSNSNRKKIGSEADTASRLLFLNRLIDSTVINPVVIEAINLRAKFYSSVILEYLTIIFSSKNNETLKGKVEEIESTLQQTAKFEDLPPPQPPKAIDEWTREFNNLEKIPPKQCRILSSLDTHVWVFSNHIEVLYKSTPCDDSGIHLNFVIPQGLQHQSSRQEAAQLVFGIELLNSLGLGSMTKNEMRLIDLQMTRSCSIGVDSCQFSFHIKEDKNLYLCLQLLYSRLTDMTPFKSKEFDENWESLKTQYNIKWNQSNDSECYNSAHEKMLSEDHPFLMPFNEEIASLDKKETAETISRFFQQLSQARLVICGGKITNEDLQSLLEKYIGSIKSLDKKIPEMIPLTFTPGLKVTIEQGEITNLSTATLYFQIRKIHKPEEQMHHFIAHEVIKRLLHDRIREKQQLNYEINFDVFNQSNYFDFTIATINFSSETRQLETLKSKVLEEVDSFSHFEDSDYQQFLEASKSAMLRIHHNRKQTPSFWVTLLSFYITSNYNLEDLSHRASWIESMTMENLKDAIKLIFERKNEHKTYIFHPKS